MFLSCPMSLLWGRTGAGYHRGLCLQKPSSTAEPVTLRPLPWYLGLRGPAGVLAAQLFVQVRPRKHSHYANEGCNSAEHLSTYGGAENSGTFLQAIFWKSGPLYKMGSLWFLCACSNISVQPHQYTHYARHRKIQKYVAKNQINGKDQSTLLLYF